MIVGVTAYVIPILAAMLLVRPRDIMRNIMFVLLSITTAVAPSVGIAFFSYEFPTLIGMRIGGGSVLRWCCAGAALVLCWCCAGAVLVLCWCCAGADGAVICAL